MFFALWPDNEATAHLSALAHELTTRGGGRVMRPASRHLTLAFVGAVTPGQLSRLPAVQSVGQLAVDILRPWSPLVAKFRNVTDTTDEITVGDGVLQCRYEVRLSALA